MIRWSAHLAMLFREADPLERPRLARDAGFSVVESWWPEPDPVAWARAVEAAGIEVALLNAFAGDIPAGERGFLTDPWRHGETLDHIAAAVDLAKRLGCPNVNVLAGKATGRGADADLEAVITVLGAAAPVAAEAGVALLLEPLNLADTPGYVIPDAATAVQLLERVASPAARLLYDAFHAARSGHDPGFEVARFGPWIAHVQYADAPGRGAPGTGDNDIDRLLEALAAAGYTGAIGLEYNPDGPTPISLAALPRRPGLVAPLS